MIDSKRSDKKKNQVKVIKELLKDPLQTERELAKKTGLSNGSAHNYKSELEQTGATSKTIDKICENDKELMNLVSGLNVREVKKIVAMDTIELNDLKVLNDITEKSTRRYTLFKGDVTDSEGGLKQAIYKPEDIKEMSMEQINEARKAIIAKKG